MDGKEKSLLHFDTTKNEGKGGRLAGWEVEGSKENIESHIAPTKLNESRAAIDELALFDTYKP